MKFIMAELVKNNDGFAIKNQPIEIDYSMSIGADKVLKLLKENNYTKIRINEDCIVGWAEKILPRKPDCKER